MTTLRRTPVLVLGLGNVICGDDGAGVVAVHRLLRDYELPEGVLAVDGGTLGLSLLPLVDAAERLILVDAVAADQPPGTLVRLDGDEVGPAVYERLSPHQIGVADLMAGAALVGRYPDEVVLIGVVPRDTELALGRSPEVEVKIDELVARVVDELVRMGFAPAVRRGGKGAAGGEHDDIARALGL